MATEVKMICPYCDDETGHLYYSVEKKVYHCHKCGASGRGRPDAEVLREIDVDKEPASDVIWSSPKLSGIFSNTIMGKKARRFLKSKGLYKSEVKRYRLGVAFDRLFIPVYNDDGDMIYWLGRTLTGEKIKYKNAPRPATDIIFKTFKGKVDKAEVCEGIFDAVRIARVMPAVALLGKELTEEKSKKIIDNVSREIIIMLDSDAIRHSFKLYDKLRGYRHVTLRCLAHGDPGEMSVEELERRLL